MKSFQRVATRYLKADTSDRDNLHWAADQLREANNLIENAVLVLTARHPGGHGEGYGSIADDNGHVNKVVDVMQRATGTLDHAARSLDVEASASGRTAASPNRMDPRIKRQIGNAFRLAGLDENKSFDKAEQGYSVAWDVLAGFNIVVDDIIDSHIFRADDGQANLKLAFKTSDPFTNIRIINSLLVFTFHRKENGKFGCLVYVS